MIAQDVTYVSVPDEFATIQDAIDAAQDGDTVLVAPGTYYENLEIEGKNITLASHFLTTQDFAVIDQTIIDGGENEFVLSIAEDVGPETIITGFTFRNADDGILSFGDMTFTFNHVTEVSDGIDFEGGGGLVQNSRFDFNLDDGIDLDDETAVVIENNWIADNGDDGIEIRFHPYEGPKLVISILSNWIAGNKEDGIQLIDYDGLSSRNLLIQDNLIINNAMVGIGSTSDGNTTENYEGSSSVEPTFVFNNTFVGNNHALTGGDNLVALNNLFVDSSAIAVKNVDSQSILSHNLFWGNGVDSTNSNVDLNTTLWEDPLLDPESFAPLSGSSAIDAGAAIFSWQDQLVMVLPEGSYYGVARDLGAFETSPNYRRTKLEPSTFYSQSPSFYGIDALEPASPVDVLPDLDTLLRNSSAAILVETIETSLFSPPSPDPSGITYIPTSNSLLVVDSEINEWISYTGENLYPLDLSGGQLGVLSAFPFTNEPTGLEYNPINNHLFVSDDDSKQIFEIDPGADGLYRTADDIMTSFDTKNFDSSDPEGIAFDSANGVLFVANGITSEIYRISPGPNRLFDGIAPEGDDEVTHFDTGTFGIRDPEGIGYDPNTGNLFVVGGPGDIMLEMTTAGQVVRIIDISEAKPRSPGGVTVAPSSYDPSTTSVFITDPGLDIVNLPDSNDGKIYEFSLPSNTPGNLPPIVNANADLLTSEPGTAILRSRVSDDRVPTPNPLAPPVSVWKQVSGPGLAELTGLNATDVLAKFPFTGKYVFRVVVSDGELASSDDVTIIVTEGLDKLATVLVIETSVDDAEERGPGGGMRLGRNALEIGFDGSNQRVGLRFNEVYIPRRAKIVDAYIQFQADEPDLDEASFTIEGHDIGNARAFDTQRQNLSFRARTSAFVVWSPGPWTLEGESGLDQRTPNISSIIEEIVGRGDWTSGNSLAITLTGTGRRSAVSFDGDPRMAPVLYIEYEPSA